MARGNEWWRKGPLKRLGAKPSDSTELQRALDSGVAPRRQELVREANALMHSLDEIDYAPPAEHPTIFDTWAVISDGHRRERELHPLIGEVDFRDHNFENSSSARALFAGLLPHLTSARRAAIHEITSYFEVEPVDDAASLFLSNLQIIAVSECDSDRRPLTRLRIFSEVGEAAEQLGAPQVAVEAFQTAFGGWLPNGNPLTNVSYARYSLELVGRSRIGESRLRILSALDEASPSWDWTIGPEAESIEVIEFVEVAADLIAEAEATAEVESLKASGEASLDPEHSQILELARKIATEVAEDALHVIGTSELVGDLGGQIGNVEKIMAATERAGIDFAPRIWAALTEHDVLSPTLRLEVAAKLISGGHLNQAYQLIGDLPEPRFHNFQNEPKQVWDRREYLVSYFENLLAMLALTRQNGSVRTVGGQHEPQVVAKPALTVLTAEQLRTCEELLERCGDIIYEALPTANPITASPSAVSELKGLQEKVEQSRSANQANEIFLSCETSLFDGPELRHPLSGAELAAELQPAIDQLIVLQSFDVASRLLEDIGVALCEEVKQAMEANFSMLVDTQPDEQGVEGRALARGLARKTKIVAVELDRVETAELGRPRNYWAPMARLVRRAVTRAGRQSTGAEQTLERQQRELAVARSALAGQASRNEAIGQ